MSMVELGTKNSRLDSTVRKGLQGQRISIAISNESVGEINAIAWWTMFACSSTALMTSCYLAWAALTSSPVAGCGGGGSIFDCSHVLHSRWSMVLSLPVSVPAIATHVLILSMLMAKPLSHRLQQARWALIGFASLTAAAAAIWFIGIQIFWIEHLCSYCLVAHAGALVLASVFLWNRPAQVTSLKWIVVASAVAVSSLILLQTTNAAPLTHELINHPETSDGDGTAPAEEATLFEAPSSASKPQAFKMRNGMFSGLTMLMNPSMLLNCGLAAEVDDGKGGGKVHAAQVLSSVKLETNVWPLLGKPDAELVFVELFDYTCEHCQKTHKAIEGARQRMGDRLAIIALPVPLDVKCNPTVKSTEANHMESCAIAKLAIAVWYVDHDKFAEFHNYLFDKKPTYAVALTKAQESVDPEKLTTTLSGSIPSEYVSKHISLYQKAGAGTIPKLMFPKTTSVGAIESTDVMVQLIEQHLR